MVKELVKLTRKINLKNNIFILEFESNKIAKAKPGQFVSLLVEGLTLLPAACNFANFKQQIQSC